MADACITKCKCTAGIRVCMYAWSLDKLLDHTKFQSKWGQVAKATERTAGKVHLYPFNRQSQGNALLVKTCWIVCKWQTIRLHGSENIAGSMISVEAKCTKRNVFNPSSKMMTTPCSLVILHLQKTLNSFSSHCGVLRGAWCSIILHTARFFSMQARRKAPSSCRGTVSYKVLVFSVFEGKWIFCPKGVTSDEWKILKFVLIPQETVEIKGARQSNAPELCTTYTIEYHLGYKKALLCARAAFKCFPFCSL